jgi:hypothetical protein
MIFDGAATCSSGGGSVPCWGATPSCQSGTSPGGSPTGTTRSPASWPFPCTTGALHFCALHEMDHNRLSDSLFCWRSEGRCAALPSRPVSLRSTKAVLGCARPRSISSSCTSRVVVQRHEPESGMCVAAVGKVGVMCMWRSTHITLRSKQTFRRRCRVTSGRGWSTPTLHRQRWSIVWEWQPNHEYWVGCFQYVSSHASPRQVFFCLTHGQPQLHTIAVCRISHQAATAASRRLSMTCSRTRPSCWFRSQSDHLLLWQWGGMWMHTSALDCLLDCSQMMVLAHVGSLVDVAMVTDCSG